MTKASQWLGMHCATARDRRNQWRVNRLLLTWMLVWLGANLANTRGLLPSSPLVTGAELLLTTGLGLWMMRAYWHYLSQADELLRKIELEGLALALGTGLIATLGLQLLVATGLPADEDLLTYLFTLMILVYGAGVMLGHRRYA